MSLEILLFKFNLSHINRYGEDSAMENRPLFILAGNGPYENLGCEAIVRGTVDILRKSFTNPYFLAVTHFDNPVQYATQKKNETDSDISHAMLYQPVRRLTIPWFRRLKTKIQGRHYNLLNSATWGKELSMCCAVLSIGGDNYSLDYGIPRFHIDLDDYVYDAKKPLIIWGASIGPFRKVPEFEAFMKEHFKKVTAFFVRESISMEYLADLGFTSNVFRAADPAFIMKPHEPSKGKLNIPILNDAIGLNLSPLLGEYVRGISSHEWTVKTAKIIEHIAVSLNRPIYLIPHVTVPHSNDYTHLCNAFSIIEKRDEIYLVPPVLSAQETKWLIGKMAVFAGARTHATIASLSQGIPTLSFAYSIKAYGINKDIFNDTQFCLDIDSIQPGIIVERLSHLLRHSKEIRKKIFKNLPNIRNMAQRAGEYLYQILYN